MSDAAAFARSMSAARGSISMATSSARGNTLPAAKRNRPEPAPGVDDAHRGYLHRWTRQSWHRRSAVGYTPLRACDGARASAAGRRRCRADRHRGQWPGGSAPSGGETGTAPRRRVHVRPGSRVPSGRPRRKRAPQAPSRTPRASSPPLARTPQPARSDAPPPSRPPPDPGSAAPLRSWPPPWDAIPDIPL